ncbi:MAG: imidazolonepropionase [Candidatus Marinimicrobia bacterium]|jgi:imidazolonepropionase|nr:imidazolonepropionase [Candidatus Neomarinimicrobiota bacterium]MBT3634050.1 imidazolonepropionase [Candidatus Neomarinimicrobiota bacterium]MBT3683076.1 imidazolonepropionase [Candidatus Neomarinimicrobiota bacterium]MBT3759832.1 imidazolonepropionase [Candidatus Neomarinimicrobiota bacterium]MBT3895715.1 imidazolonepropionase [Candidatus Neomarinimicrobiota bacterium]
MKTKITNIGSIVTWSEEDQKVLKLENTEILIDNEMISDIAEKVDGAEIEIDADRAMVTPGFVDSHTHPIFVGNRSNEFSMRVDGKSYKEIAEKGGGIISSIKGVRKASEDQLFEYGMDHLEIFLAHGTTTIEAKSGYGLDLESEIKSLRVIKKLNEESVLDVIPTFLGAHSFPPEYSDNHEGFVDLVCGEMIPAIASENLAKYCDVFCEDGYFTVNQSRRILETAKEFGIAPRLHADEFKDSGAAELAAEIGAVSADHLMAASEKGIKAMILSGVIATILPGTTLFLGMNKYVDGRKLIDSGCDVSLATDFNPGSCTIQSMPLIISLAVLYCGMTIEEAFKAATYTGAKSIGLKNRAGQIKSSCFADLLFWESENLNEIPYWMGSDRLISIMKRGKLLE